MITSVDYMRIWGLNKINSIAIIARLKAIAVSEINRMKISSEQSDDDSEKSNEDINTDNSPKIIPVAKMPQKLITKKIVINISDTQYGIIEQIAEQLGWIIQKKQGIGNWDIWWTDRQITPDTLYRMNLHQKINHFPGIDALANKNLLGLNLMAMKSKFMAEYNFFPDTWTIPLQFSQFRSYYEGIAKNMTFIIKPQNLSQGRGIFLTNNIEDIITGQKYVVQRYISNPYLINKLKFDLRIYVLLAGTEPLRIYIYEQGLARFATQAYQEPHLNNLHCPYIHLTNYSLNKNNPQYIYNTSKQQMNIGHKRTLSSIYEHLAQQGHNITKLKSQINSIIVKTVIAGYPAIFHQYRYCQPQDYENNMCFHILGFDIMITNDLKPYLIEVNHTPSFETGTPLDYEVKKKLIIDSLGLMRITESNKKSRFEYAKVVIKKRVETGRREIVRDVHKRKQLITEAQMLRDLQEEELLGGFKKIYPIASSMKSDIQISTADTQRQSQITLYEQMIERSIKVHQETDQVRRKIIKEEQSKNLKQSKQRQSKQQGTKQQGSKQGSKQQGSKQQGSQQQGSKSQQNTQQQHLPNKVSKQKDHQKIHEDKLNLLSQKSDYCPKFKMNKTPNHLYQSEQLPLISEQCDQSQHIGSRNCPKRMKLQSNPQNNFNSTISPPTATSSKQIQSDQVLHNLKLTTDKLTFDHTIQADELSLLRFNKVGDITNMRSPFLKNNADIKQRNVRTGLFITPKVYQIGSHNIDKQQEILRLKDVKKLFQNIQKRANNSPMYTYQNHEQKIIFRQKKKLLNLMQQISMSQMKR